MPNINETELEHDPFLTLMRRVHARCDSAIIRSHVNGLWRQFCAPDFFAHIMHSLAFWQNIKANKQSLNQEIGNTPCNLINNMSQNSNTIAILSQKNTYALFVETLGALFAGLDVCLINEEWLHGNIENKNLTFPVEFDFFGIWSLNASKHLTKYNKVNTLPSNEYYSNNSIDTFDNFIDKTEKLGNLKFIIPDHFNLEKVVVEEVSLENLVVLAKKVIFNLEIPPRIHWRTMELMPAYLPFTWLSMLSCLQINGILGFPDIDATWETNMRILRPSLVFTQSSDLKNIADFVAEKLNINKPKENNAFTKLLETSRDKLINRRGEGSKERFFDVSGKLSRKLSKLILNKKTLKEVREDLQVVITGNDIPNPTHIKILEKVGIPVLETYGNNPSHCVISTNKFSSPRLNTLGETLPGINLRLGQHSLLEFSDSQIDASLWHSTGDIVQMLPIGICVLGKYSDIILTGVDALVFPQLVEQLLQSYPDIERAFLIGNRKPFISALIIPRKKLSDKKVEDERKVKQEIGEIISDVNEKLARNSTIKNYAIVYPEYETLLQCTLPDGSFNRNKFVELHFELVSSFYNDLT